MPGEVGNPNVRRLGAALRFKADNSVGTAPTLQLGRTVLQGWKAIACALDRGVRTVQRWERTLGLPVHRIGNELCGPVIAFADELRSWLETTAISEFHPSKCFSPSTACLTPNPKWANSQPAATTKVIGGNKRIENPHRVHFLERRTLTTCNPGKTSCDRCNSSLQLLDAVLSTLQTKRNLKVRLLVCPICDFDLGVIRDQQSVNRGATSQNRHSALDELQTIALYTDARH